MKKLLLFSYLLFGFAFATFAQLSLTANVTAPLCAGGLGQINGVVSGGTAPYSYTINNGTIQTSSTFSGVAGSYTLAVTDASLTTTSLIITMTQPAVVVSTIASVTNPTCGQPCAGTIVFSNSGGVGSLTTSPSPFNLCAGSYTFTTTDANGCTATANTALNNISPITLVATTTMQSCQSTSDGSIHVTAYGGVAPLAFTISNYITPTVIGNSATFTNLGSNNYSINVVDANGCYANMTTTVFLSPNAVVVNQLSITNYTNCANPVGTATCLASGAGTLTYSWNNGVTFSNSNILNNVPVGAVNVIVTNGTCTSYGYTNLAPMQNFEYKNNTCLNSTPSGQVFMNTVGGMMPMVYNIAGNISSNTFAGNLAAGVYTYSVTDAVGCTITDSFIIGYDTVTINIVPSYLPNGCLDSLTAVVNNNNSINYAATWTTMYQYIGWTNSIASTQISDSIVYVSGNNGACTAMDTFVVNPTTSVGLITLNNLPPSCGQPLNSIKAFTLNTIGNIYNWAGLSISGQGTDSIYNLPASQMYQVQVTNAMGCSASSSVLTQVGITNANFWSINNDTICKGESKLFSFNSNFSSNYAVDIFDANGQVASVNLNLLGVTLGPTVTSTYTAYLNDPYSCIAADTFTVYVKNTNFTTSLNITDASCANSADGNLVAVNSPTTPSAQYLWLTNNATTAILQNVATGYYSVKVSDALGGCQVITGHVGIQASACANISGTVYWDANNNCSKDANEPTVKNALVALVDANGDSTKQLTSINGAYNFTSLLYGTYTIVQISNYINTNLCGNATTVTLTASNNNIIHHFADTLPSFDHLAGVQSSTACIVPANLNQIKKLYVFVNNPQLASTGSAAAYWVKDTNFTITSISPAATYTSTNGDTLFWTLQDLPNNFATITYTIPPFLSTGLYLNNLYGLQNVTNLDNNLTNNFGNYYINTCTSYDPNDKEVQPKGPLNNGYITLADKSLLYTIRFQNTGNAVAVNVVVKDTIDVDLNINTIEMIMASHAYIVKIVGREVTFTFPQIMLPESSFDEPNSHGIFIFKIKQQASNGPGTVVKNNAAIYFDYNTPIITNTTFTKIFDSLQNTLLQKTPTSSCLATGNGKVNWSINGGLPPYQYSVIPATTGLVYNANSIENFVAGNYTIVATDAIGQTLSTLLTIQQSSNFVMGSVVTMPYTGNPGLIDLFPTGGLAPYSYLWKPTNETTSSITNLVNGTYSVTVTDALGCTVSAKFVVTATAINDVSESVIKIYPNPTSDAVYLESKQELGLIEVYAMDGKLIATKNFGTNSKGTIYVSNFAEGNYIIKNKQGKLIAKFMVMHK